MTTYRRLMVELDGMLKERVTVFFMVCAVQDITPDELGTDVMDGIGNALGNLAEMSRDELPSENNYRAMQMLAEYMTIVKLQNDALLVLSNIPDDLRGVLLDNGHELKRHIITMATIE